MTEATPASDSQTLSIERIQAVFQVQKSAFDKAPYPSASQRRQKLKAIKKQISRYQDVLAHAMHQDFGCRSHAESKMLDLLGSTLEANHAISHVKRWMQPSRRGTELLFLTNKLEVRYQPKGVVGVIVPWNFPVYLALGPLIAAIAAGNRVMVKMPEITPHTNAALKKMLADIFSEDEVFLIGEEMSTPSDFTALPFNHLIFTGSPAVGKIVMRQAADNLTPVTLELGGKSPAVVSRHYPIADAAKRITHGKATNAGQICVSPDYALVPRESMGTFVESVRASYAQLFKGSVQNNNDYTWIINDRHVARIQELLADAVSKGATVVACAAYDAAQDRRNMPLHVVTDCTPDMRIMQEEIFGPILPVVSYDTPQEVIAFINKRPRPLALYCFSHHQAERRQLLEQTHSGGVTINDWGWHVVNHDAPFGGVGNSGMGTYHGEEGFCELSHAKTVFKRHRFFPIGLFYPPYGNFVQLLALRLFLGSADPKL